MRNNGFATGLMYVLLVFLLVGLAILIFFNYQINTQQMAEREAAEIAAAATPTPEPTSTPEPTPTPSRVTETVTLAFAGDLVGQPGLTTDAASSDGDDDSVTYDFFDELEGVVPSLNGVDFAACTLVGTAYDSSAYDTGYHMPAAIATALAGSGFQVVNLATDHILELGFEGLEGTVRTLQNEGLVPIGAYSSQQSHGAFMADIHGVKVALLSYTCGTGGVSIADQSWCLDVMTQDYMTEQVTMDYDRIDADIAAVREAGADIVVCFAYWWDSTQYYTVVRQNQSDVADHLFAKGVDIVIGGGVKTPQPIETRQVEREDGSKANCAVCYSLSNLMSCFNDRYTNLSATALITISRDTETGECWISGVSYEPLFMLDTDDYDDYVEPSYKLRLLDAYKAIEDYENGDTTVLSAKAHDALLTGVADLQDLMGAEYDVANGGVMMDYPY